MHFEQGESEAIDFPHIIKGVSYNQLYNLAFVKLIEAYEAKNGKVKVKPNGKGLEGI